jgi:hypothetical protein
VSVIVNHDEADVTFLVCEDVRMEIDRKLSVLGLFADRVIYVEPGTEKVQFPLSLIFIVPYGRKSTCTFTVSGPDGPMSSPMTIEPKAQLEDANSVSPVAVVAAQFRPTPKISRGEYSAQITMGDISYTRRFSIRDRAKAQPASSATT